MEVDLAYLERHARLFRLELGGHSEIYVVPEYGRRVEDTEISEAWAVLEDDTCVDVTGELLSSPAAQVVWEELAARFPREDMEELRYRAADETWRSYVDYEAMWR